MRTAYDAAGEKVVSCLAIEQLISQIDRFTRALESLKAISSKTDARHYPYLRGRWEY
jgi:hypothetical protein